MLSLLKEYVHKREKSFFNFQKRVLVFMGLSIPENSNYRLAFYLYAFLIQFLVIATISVLVIPEIIMERKNFQNLSFNLVQLSLQIVIVVQVYAWFSIKGPIFRVIDIIERPTFEFRTMSISKINTTYVHNEREEVSYNELANLKETAVEWKKEK